jgi:hypothetical protein
MLMLPSDIETVFELSRLQSSVPCSASESVRSENRVTGEKDG